MAKLNQIIAVANGKKSRTQAGVTDLYHKMQKPALLEGISRTYRPRDEDGEQLPPEVKRVQVRVKEILRNAGLLWGDLMNIVATQDYANCEARADVTVKGEKVLTDVPVTHLLFLEKQLQDIRTFIGKIPTLDPAYDWEWSEEADCWATKPTETTRTKKVPRNHILYEATKEHPAQVQTFTEDVIVGYWNKTDFSGAIPEQEKNRLLDRVVKLQEAVKMAREQANGIEVKDQQIGGPLMDYLFGNTAS